MTFFHPVHRENEELEGLILGLCMCMEVLGLCSASPKISRLPINSPNLGHVGTNPGGDGVSLGLV